MADINYHEQVNKQNIEKLKEDIYKMVAEIHAGRYPFNNFLW